MIYRVYLVERPGWREFGIDYPTREGAESAANRYREHWPDRLYIVRGGNFRRISQFVTEPPRSAKHA